MASRSHVTCHVLNSVTGRPGAGINVELSELAGSSFKTLATGATDADGRCSQLMNPEIRLAPGVYQMRFQTAQYLESVGLPSFYPYVDITFKISSREEHYHIPLLLSPYAYSTYRGS